MPNGKQDDASDKQTRRKLPPIVIRGTRRTDLKALDELQSAAYPRLSQEIRWKDRHWLSHIEHFAGGQFVAEVDGKVIGCCGNLLVPFEKATGQHTWKEITDKGTIASTHDPQGDTLYGFEIMVHPDHRRRGVGRKLYEARFDYARDHGLRAFCAMGRIPGYRKREDEFDPDEYVQKVVDGAITDRTLTAQMRSGLRVVGTVLNYLHDPNSGDAAAILIWDNPDLDHQRSESDVYHRARDSDLDLVVNARA